MLSPFDRLEIDALLNHLPQRTHVAQLLDMLDGLARRIVDLILGGKAANAEANRRVCQVVVGTDRTQHIRRLERRRRARASRRERYVLAAHEQALALHIRERDVHAAGIAMLQVAIDHHVRQLARYLIDEAFGEHLGALQIEGHLFLGDTARGAQSDHKTRGHSAAAQATLLAAAALDGLESDARLAPYVQRAHTLGSVDLVAADGHEIDAALVHVDGHFADRLGRVRVEEDATRTTQATDVVYLLKHADLVVHRHDGDERRLGPDRLVEFGEID